MVEEKELERTMTLATSLDSLNEGKTEIMDL